MRVKIFILVAVLFGGTIFAIVSLRYLEVHQTIERKADEIAQFVKKMDYEKRKDVLQYLNISIVEIENQIQALFKKINEWRWMKERFLPTSYHKFAKGWESASVLMMTEQWIDLIQTTDQGELTASIVARPPYVGNFICVPINSVLSVIIPMGKKEVYIGVPYWTEGLVYGETIEIEKGVNKENRLLFTVEELLTMDTKALKRQHVEWYATPLDPSEGIGSSKEYVRLLDAVIESIQIVQAELKKEPELVSILTTQSRLNTWITGKIKVNPETMRKDIPCTNYLCEAFKSEAETEHWVIEEGWNFRYEQNQFIWKMGTLIGSGIWNFDPFAKESPRGICSFLKEDLSGNHSFCEGRGILVEDVFQKELIPFFYDCKPSGAGVCVSKDLDVVTAPYKKGVFLTNTMIYERDDHGAPAYGTITIGKSINGALQQLALVVPGSILFVTESGKTVFFNENGEISDTANWGDIDFSKLLEEKTGVIKDVSGREFLFIHLMPLIEGKGQVFVLELKQDVFQMLQKLKTNTGELMHMLLLENTLLGGIALLIGLLILNHILKRGIAPLTELATTTKLIALGQLERIHIPDLWKKRKDEVGVLCIAFDQMVIEMKEALKVRNLLNKVVSKEIADKILRDGVQLGGETREVTILFADIRNFTHISETMAPEAVLEMLNSCLTILSRVIDDHEGVIDKYIGDEIMAIFGAPVDMPNPAFQAVMCAKTMIEVLAEWNEMRKERNLLPLTIGISVHTGSVIAGNIGAENHLSYTVLGHNVNLASRVADHAQGMEILITEETLKAPNVSDNISFEPLQAPVSFKGISKPLLLYRIL